MLDIDGRNIRKYLLHAGADPNIKDNVSHYLYNSTAVLGFLAHLAESLCELLPSLGVHLLSSVNFSHLNFL
jgi:hypothetical protein